VAFLPPKEPKAETVVARATSSREVVFMVGCSLLLLKEQEVVCCFIYGRFAVCWQGGLVAVTWHGGRVLSALFFSHTTQLKQ
jgi:hypothetical protein